MKTISSKELLKTAANSLKNGAPTILTCIGAVGVATTAIFTAKAVPKATAKIKSDSRLNHDGDPYASTVLEKIKSGWYFYIPAVISGLATISCIFGANVLNRRQQASLMSAYAFLHRS